MDLPYFDASDIKPGTIIVEITRGGGDYSTTKYFIAENVGELPGLFSELAWDDIWEGGDAGEYIQEVVEPSGFPIPSTDKKDQEEDDEEDDEARDELINAYHEWLKEKIGKLGEDFDKIMEVYADYGISQDPDFIGFMKDFLDMHLEDPDFEGMKFPGDEKAIAEVLNRRNESF